MRKVGVIGFLAEFFAALFFVALIAGVLAVIFG